MNIQINTSDLNLESTRAILGLSISLADATWTSPMIVLFTLLIQNLDGEFISLFSISLWIKGEQNTLQDFKRSIRWVILTPSSTKRSGILSIKQIPSQTITDFWFCRLSIKAVDYDYTSTEFDCCIDYDSVRLRKFWNMFLLLITSGPSSLVLYIFEILPSCCSL